MTISSLKLINLRVHAEREKRKRRQQPTPDAWLATARPEQLAPAGDWLIWYIQAGRGWGKTRTGAEWMWDAAKLLPRVAIVAESFGEGRDTCIEGESGIKTLHPDLNWNRSMGEMTFPSGARGKIFSAEDPESLRGPNNYAAWCDEIAKWRYLKLTWDNLMMTMRKGEIPQTVITTTPRPLPFLKHLRSQPDTHLTRGRTYDNIANLSQVFINKIVKPYEGTMTGRQELEAEDIDDMPGALWQRSQIEALRVTKAPTLTRIVVGVDPSATSTGDEAGIIVAGIGTDGHGYVFDDRSIQGSPQTWAKAAVSGYHIHKADRLIAESNQGGEMVAVTISTIPDAPQTKLIHASRNKQTRAEPVASLYEQGRVHHVGALAKLEDELCSWQPGMASPNRLDALVWALTELMLHEGQSIVNDYLNRYIKTEATQ